MRAVGGHEIDDADREQIIVDRDRTVHRRDLECSLGLGQNGHLGFNEPGSEEDSAARVVNLESISVEANRRWFGGDYAPSKGVSAGLRTILAARHVLLLACGTHKATAVKALIEGPRSPRCPASFLQGHPDTRIFVDQMAASGLDRQD